MSAYSALGNLLFRSPFAPDYELSKHLMAVAVFMFLPYCQIAGANVNVDIFTERLDPRAKAVMSVVAAVLAASFALLLLRQMTLGFDGYLRYPEVTPVLGLPLWTAFPPILISLGLLLAAALMTLADAFGGLRGKSGRFSLEETDADA
ncbi:MAG: TRAP transporter small permease subunit [Hyphomicrobiaceae bacterium]|nr:TRAP transporter small permease subunit [Hyphomicrobiaceae bacterium]